MTAALVKHNTTLAQIAFYTWEHGKIEVLDPTYGASIRGPIKSVSTDKRLGEAAGRFTIELTPYVQGGPFGDQPWSDVVEEGDWVTIDVTKNGVPSCLMVGQIDLVEVAISADGSGAPVATVRITGRDAGAPLQDTPVYFNPFDPVHNNAAGKDMARVLTTITGAPHEVITAAIQGFFGVDGLYGGHRRVPGQLVGAAEAPWVDVLGMEDTRAGGTVQHTLRGTVFAPSMLSADQSGSVWSFLDSWRNPALNELWIDTTSAVSPRRWYLNLRERPFVNAADGVRSPWFGMQARIIDARTVQSAALSRGNNRINHVMLFGDATSMLGQDAYALYTPVADFASVERYGLRKLEEQSRYFDSVGQDAGFVVEYRAWLDLIVSWNCLNHQHWEGSLSIAELRPDIRVGHKVALSHGPLGHYPGLPADEGPGRELTFYVEGVSHRLAFGRAPTLVTSLRVSRGYVEADRLAAVTAAAAQFQGVALVPEGSANSGVLEPTDAAAGVQAGLEPVEAP